MYSPMDPKLQDQGLVGMVYNSSTGYEVHHSFTIQSPQILYNPKRANQTLSREIMAKQKRICKRWLSSLNPRSKMVSMQVYVRGRFIINASSVLFGYLSSHEGEKERERVIVIFA
jgi:hypothetical protein